MNSASAAKSIYIQAENASKKDFISEVHPYIKLISLIYIVIVISVVSNLFTQIIATVFIFSLFIFARLKVFTVYKKIFFLAFLFGFLIVLPASLNLITPGKIILNLFTLNKPLHFWIYNVPQQIGFTENGIRVVSLSFSEYSILSHLQCLLFLPHHSRLLLNHSGYWECRTHF